MNYNINEKILSMPPYISTSWENVSALYIDDETSDRVLIISLKQGNPIRIPNLDQSLIDKVFQAHASFLSTHDQPKQKSESSEVSSQGNLLNNANNIPAFGFPMKFAGSLEGLGSAMQHNPDQAGTPDLPKEILEKIGAVAKILGTDEVMNVPNPEPHCNCIHCQIARAIIQSTEREEVEESKVAKEDIVTDDDLRFRNWDIIQNDKQIYMVINPLDKKEQYRVFLGEPIGCTCGEKNCEHVRAVLNS